MPSTPGAPLLRFTRANASFRLSLSTIASIARSGQRRRAFDCGARRIGFGPSGAVASGFTRRPLAESQFELDFRPLGQCENSALLALSTVRAFGRSQAYYALC